MTDVNVREAIDAPADKVWALIGDFGGLARIGLVPDCSVEGAGPGAVRTLDMGGGTIVRERLDAVDHDGRTLTYSIVEAGPLPVTQYQSTVRVVPDGPDRCEVDWTGRFEPAPGADAQARETVEGIYRGGISGLRKALGI